MTKSDENFFTKYDWNTILELYPSQNYDINLYHQILCPENDYPDFINKYVELPVMQRLKGVGLLCGTDWTPLYKNQFYYSRLDHSIGVALIIWHFTHNKAQTLSGLFHDISTPVFSHVSDFRKGDALTQTATEAPTAKIIRNDKELQKLLALDHIISEEIEDYHLYPVADNEIPQLSADRLEYMFPSGMALAKTWSMEEIKNTYNDISVQKNEYGKDELGFNSLEIAQNYCKKFCMIGHILQLNENKLTLQLLGKIMNQSLEEKILTEEDFMQLSEEEVMEKIENSVCSSKLKTLFHTFRTMTFVEHTSTPEENCFCVSLKVKQRYINPLVKVPACKAASNENSAVARKASCKSEPAAIQNPACKPDSAYKNTACKPDFISVRLSAASPEAKKIIEDFLKYQDTAFGCVRLINNS